MPSDSASKNEGSGGRKPGSGYTAVLKTENYCAAFSICSCITWRCPDLIHPEHFMPTEHKGEFNSPKSQGLTLWQYIMKEQERAEDYCCWGYGVFKGRTDEQSKRYEGILHPSMTAACLERMKGKKQRRGIHQSSLSSFSSSAWSHCKVMQVLVQNTVTQPPWDGTNFNILKEFMHFGKNIFFLLICTKLLFGVLISRIVQ